MNQVSKFSFIFKTDHGNGKITERVLAETPSRDRASMLRHRFRSIAGGFTQMRSCKKICILSVNKERFAIFETTEPPAKGTTFNSIDALADAIGANPVTLRATLSRARGNNTSKATVRGITYAYAD